MKKNTCTLKIFSILFFFSLQTTLLMAQKNEREYYEIKVYHFKDLSQEKVLDNYFQNALIPALHKVRINNVGVFKALSNDTSADKLMYVFMPVKTLDEVNAIGQKLENNTEYQTAAHEYLSAPYDAPVFTRVEIILLRAFPLAPKINLPQLHSAKNSRVYELRSYESATENLHVNKVKMFNEGGEIDLFKRLNFNAIFYAQVVTGCKMPNLMYMTSFENMQDREAHWKAFGEDSVWKQLSALPEYQHNVSHIDITFLHPTDYSDL
jgi:hypothetical protein